MLLLVDHWLELFSQLGFFMETQVLKTQGFEGGVEWVDKVIFARLGPKIFEAAVVECLGYDPEFGSALLGDFGVDNALDSSLNVVRRLRVYADLDGRKMLVAVEGGGAGRALGSNCVSFRMGYGTP